MSELIDAPEIAEIEDGDLLPMRKAAAGGLLKATFGALKAALLAGGTFLPTGGTLGQVLGKASSDDGDVEWIDQTGGGGGGSDLPALTGNAGKVLGVNDAETDVEWIEQASGGGGGGGGRKYPPTKFPLAAMFTNTLATAILTDDPDYGLQAISSVPTAPEVNYCLKPIVAIDQDYTVILFGKMCNFSEYSGFGILLTDDLSVSHRARLYNYSHGGVSRTEGDGAGNFQMFADVWMKSEYKASTGVVTQSFSRDGKHWLVWGSTNNLVGFPPRYVGFYLQQRSNPELAQTSIIFYGDTDIGFDLDTGGGSGGGIEEAPIDGNIYARQNEAWVEVDVEVVTPFHRYWRYLQTGAGTLNCVELEFRSERGGADITPSTGGQAIARDSYSGAFLPANAFDNNTATAYGPNTGGAGSYIGYDFGAGNAVEVVEFTYDARFSGGQPAGGELQYSDDGAGWLTAFTVPAIPGTAIYTINSDGLT